VDYNTETFKVENIVETVPGIREGRYVFQPLLAGLATYDNESINYKQ
jgi:hypothetical protein